MRRIRDGKMYNNRGIDVIQGENKSICFTCTAIFKSEEADHLNLQERVDVSERYKVAIQGKRPEDHEEAPGVDSPWSVTQRVLYFRIDWCYYG